MIQQNLFLTVIKTTGTNEGKAFYSIRSMVLRCMILSVVLRLGSWACDFDDGQVMIVHCKFVWLKPHSMSVVHPNTSVYALTGLLREMGVGLC